MRNLIDSFFDNPHSDYYQSEEFEETGLNEDGTIPTMEELEKDWQDVLGPINSLIYNPKPFSSKPQHRKHINITI